MKSFIKKNLGKLILALVFAIAGAVITGFSLKPKVFYEVDKTVQTVEFDDNNAYLTFKTVGINEEFGKLNVKTLIQKKRTWNKNARIHKNDR